MTRGAISGGLWGSDCREEMMVKLLDLQLGVFYLTTAVYG